ncbi:hypothetical protein AB0425_17470 [Actinosynnema sp. NPDC051121]
MTDDSTMADRVGESALKVFHLKPDDVVLIGNLAGTGYDGPPEPRLMEQLRARLPAAGGLFVFAGDIDLQVAGKVLLRQQEVPRALRAVEAGDLVGWMRRQIQHDRDAVASLLDDPPDDGQYLTAHRPVHELILNSPEPPTEVREVLARCAAFETLLDEHLPVPEEDGSLRCRTCGDWENGLSYDATPAKPWPCITVRATTSAFQHRAGYRREWGP